VVAFEWDERKNEVNWRKHGVSFEIVERIDWDNVYYRDDLDHEGEDRYVAYGYAPDGFGYVIAFTFRQEARRIISVRRFAKGDYRRYPPAAL